MEDDAQDGLPGDITGEAVPSCTRAARKIVIRKEFEALIYICIVVAAVVSGMQSYKVDSP